MSNSLPTKNMQLTDIQNDWTLFLDRDGVINHDKDNDYIRNWQEFRFYDTTRKALQLLADKFATIVVVTNQKGVGRGLMTQSDLEDIHRNMLNDIREAGGRIDRIYYCTDLSNDSPNRKPNPGMAMQARADFPQIDFRKSLMVGNRTSDMGFGRNAGMYTVFLATTHPETPFPDPDIDFRFADLLEFAQALQ